ncbi:MAG: hypothetical protein HC838_14885 [Spirulinaceae cyanobacterium RM2_2_10]|nr:hypothetical protein [Spirulinaceae cyanobacterium SM2_1_0]NJO21058.1 hypothetical protein [Spirulinaceae cyanobacterium RM2_2_10]
MVLARTQSWERVYLMKLKSFLIWSFTLGVCLMVVGLPLVILMAAMSALAAIVLQSVLPMSAVLLVVGGVVAANLLAIVVAAALLTVRGIHPEDVQWLQWLHGKQTAIKPPTYAACPLTCDLVAH